MASLREVLHKIVNHLPLGPTDKDELHEQVTAIDAGNVVDKGETPAEDDNKGEEETPSAAE